MEQAQNITSLFGSRLSSAYNQLRGDLGAPQTASETIDKLVERIQTSATVEERRTAVLGLKGLSRDWRQEVGERSLDSLLAVLQHDAPHDTEIAKAAIETLMQLCEVAEKPAKDDVGLYFTDKFLATPEPLHSLLALLSNSPSFYPRFYSLQYLAQLLASRPAIAQSYIMSAPPPGVDGILTVLDPRAPTPGGQQAGPASMGGGATEMLRNEALLLLPTMLAGNPDLQKIVAFSGAFEKLFDIIQQEGGSDGSIVVQDAMTVVSGLLRFNVSNQNYFRELSLIPSIPPILGFPTPLALDVPSPDEFALQYWPEQKLYNAGLVLGLIRSLIGGPGGGNQAAMVTGGVTRCLLELALASNAPSGLKSQALNTLTPILASSVPNQTLLSSLVVSPLVPIHADEEHPNGGFVRLPPRPAVVSLVGTIVEGDPSAGGRGLRSRAAGVNMFEAYITANDDARIDILSSMSEKPPASPEVVPSAGQIILSGLLELPTSPDAPFDPYRSLFASLLLSHLVRNSEHAKKLAREVTVPTGDDVDEDDKVSLVQLVVGNLMMAAREHSECVNRSAKEGKPVGSTEEEDWSRVMVGYLVLLCTWLWDSPKTVKEFLSESANLQVLIQPITQTTGTDSLVQGLSAFLLGVCYEFNREPGEITRATLYPILHSRIGPDQFVSRMARLREDPRFRAVQPEAFETEDTNSPPHLELDEEVDEGLELWFDWAFVDFWKNHYYTIQRSIAIDPDAVRGSSSAADDGETAAIIMSLRQKLKAQTDEVVQLQSKLSGIAGEHKQEKDTLVNEVQSLSEQVAALTTSLQAAEAKHEEHGTQLESLKSTHATALEDITKDLNDTRDKLDKASADIKTLDEIRAELESAKTRATDAEAEASKSQLRIKVLEAEVKKLEKKIEGGAGATGAAGAKGKDKDNSEDKKKIKDLEGEIETAQKKIKELEDAAEASKTEQEKKGAEAGKDAEKVKKLEEELTKANAKVAELESDSTTGGGGKKKKGKGGATGAADKKTEELEAKLTKIEEELKAEQAKREEGEKEHEDLLVLLEELSQKRKRDIALLKEKGVDVSEGEDEDDEDDEDE